MMRPAISLFCVRALNCLQNSMMLTCAWPNAGPIGGAGVALSASICSFTNPDAFFGAILFASVFGCRLSAVSSRPTEFLCTAYYVLTRDLFHLSEFQFHRRSAAEDGDH